MRKNREITIRKQPPLNTGICFEPLEPRLLLSGSWGADIDSSSTDTQMDAHGGLSQGSMVFHADADYGHTADGNLMPKIGRIDMLSQAPVLNPLGNPVPALETSVPSTSDGLATGDTFASDTESQAVANDNSDVHELILVNENVADYEQLIADIQEKDTDRIFEVVILDAGRDGIEQVGEILAGRSDLSAVHFVSHGSEGQIIIGNTYLNSDTLQENSDVVAGWGDALTETGDLLFYGCNIAAGSAGQSLLNNIADFTGADVAASDDPTGSAGLGGDWNLEYQAGSIETDVAVNSDTRAGWTHLMAAPDDIQATVTTNGGLSLNQDGGNDAYLIADDGAGLLGGLTQLSYEMQFSASHPTTLNTLVSYAEAVDSNEFTIIIRDTGDLSVYIGTEILSSAIDYNAALEDGEKHALAVTWDSTAGDWAIYVDGAIVDSGSGHNTGVSIVGGGELVFGQEQDSLDGGYDADQRFTGTIYDARLFNTVRSAAEIAASYDSTLSYDEPGLIANWTFNDLSPNGVVTDTVSGNNLTVQHVAGFTASTPALTFQVSENAANGTVVGSVHGVDADREALIASLLAADPDLLYSAEAGKFYKTVTTDSTWTDASAAALADSLNGVNGQLATIRNAAEDQIIGQLSIAAGKDLWLGGTDAASEGDWYWQQDGVDADQFWQGDATGHSIDGAYVNWEPTKPDNTGGNQNYLQYRSGEFNDEDDAQIGVGYIIELDADEVLDVTQALTYAIQSQTVAGAFAIDADSGEITVADGSLLDYETNATHTFIVRVTDVDNNTYDQAFTIALTDLTEPNTAPTDLSSGIELNTDGGSDAYLISDTGLSQSLTSTTVEIRFAANDTPFEPVFISFNNPTDDQLSIQIDEPSKNLELDFGAGTTGYASTIDYRAALVDGSIHTLSVTWDGTAGDWAVYIDGAFIESGTGLSAGTSLDTTNGQFVFGQEQDGLDSGYDSSQYFSGTFHEVRIWNDVRTAGEIAGYYQQQLDLTPAVAATVGLVANWQMNGLDGSNQVVDIVSGNNLSISHASGIGFAASVVDSRLSVDEGSSNGTHVGYVTTADADAGETFSYSLPDSAGGRFAIDGSTGEITVADGSLLDYETATSHTITVRVTDAGGDSYSEAMTIAVNDVDEVTLANSVPGAQSTDEDTTLTLSSGNGNLIYVSEDSGEILTVVLTVDNGTLTTSGAGSATVGGDGTATLTLSGAVADINLALDGLQYEPTADYNGADTLTMTTMDGDVYNLNIDADLLGLYTFDSSDPAGDSSPGGLYDGTLTGDVISVVKDGERGDVLSLGGAQDFLNVGSVMGNPTDVTLAAWVKFSSADTNGGEVITVGNDVALRVDDPGQGGVTAFFWDGSSHQYINSGVSLADGTWHHVAFSFDDTANTQTLYIDGVVAGSGAATASINYTGWFPDTRIGAHANDADVDFDFNGLIDDARIYSRALSAAEIAALAGAPARYTDTDTVAITVNPVNDDPVVANIDGDVLNYAEGDGAVILDQSTNALVSDIDSADFAGGELNIECDSGLQSTEDVFAIRNQGTGAGQIGVSGSDVTYGGVVIGTVTGGTGLDPLNIAFNSNSTAAAVSALLQNITYENTNTDNPSTGARSITIDLNDGAGGAIVTQNMTVNVSAVNDAPVFDLDADDSSGGATGNHMASFSEGDTPVAVIDSDVSITDVDHTTMASVGMIGEFNGSVDTGEEIYTIGGQQLVVGTSKLVTVTQGGTDFELDFSDGVSLSISAVASTGDIADFEALLASMTYQHTGENPTAGLRTFSLVVSDGENTSNTVVSTINVTAVNDAPTVTATATNPTYTEDNAAVDLFNTVTVSTVESGQTLTQLVITVDNVTDGTSEIITIDGSAVALTHGNNDTTVSGFDYIVSLSGNTATITIDTNFATSSEASVQALIDGLAYQNTSQDPTAATRTVTIAGITDSGGGTDTSNPGISSTVTVSTANDAPTVVAVNLGSIAEDGSLLITQADLLTGSSDADGDSLSAVNLAIASGSGSLTDHGDGTWTFTPNADWNGAVSFSFDVTDGTIPVANTASLSVTAVNDLPTTSGLADQNLSEDFADYTIDLKTIFADVETTDANLIYTLSGNSNIGVSIDVNGIATISATGNWNGTETITFTAEDQSGATVDATADFIVAAVNDAPTVANAIIDQTATEDTAFSFTFPANTFIDVDGDGLTYTSDASGWLSFNAASRTFSGTPLNGDVGKTTVTVTADDGNGSTVSDTFDIVISNTNDMPTVSIPIADQGAREGTVFSFQFANNTFSDVDTGDTLAYTASGLPGWLTFNAATRTFSGTPGNGDVGTVSITVRATDASGTFVEDQFDISVVNVNNTPTITGANTGAVTKNMDTDADGMLEAAGVLTISDPDPAESSFQAATVVGGYGTLTIDTAGNWNYAADNAQPIVQQLNAGQSINDVLTVTSADGTTHSITVTIHGMDTVVDSGVPNRDPGDEPVPVDTAPEPEPQPEPEVILPSEPELPPAEEPAMIAPGQAKPTIIASAQGINRTFFVPRISLTTAIGIGATSTEAQSGLAATLETMKRELAQLNPARIAKQVGSLFTAEALTQTLDHLQEQLDLTMAAENRQGQLVIGAATGLGVSVFAGYVVWAFRGTSLIMGALSAMPMWRCFDPLPVLLRDDEEKHAGSATDEDEKKIEELLGTQKTESGCHAARGK